jgi:hypothetical protein
MKNSLADLNNHLFAQLERLSDEDLTPAQIEIEAKRAEAMVAVSDQIIRNGGLKIQAAKILSDHGLDPSEHLKLDAGKKPLMIEGNRS